VLFDAVLELRAKVPTAVLLSPDILAYKVPEPIATLLFAVVLQRRDSNPNAVFLQPVVLHLED
jgi:hypothetical protein